VISIRTQGFTELARELQDMSKQVNFASAVAVTRTAFLARQGIYREMEAVFDRPTPYTMRSLYSTRATPTSQQAEVSFKDFAGKGTRAKQYLGPEVYGGPREAKRFEIALRNADVTSFEQRRMPSDKFALPSKYMRLDQYGNAPRGLITQILSRLRATSPDVTQRRSGSARSTRKRIREDYFVGRPGEGRLPFGIYQRATFGFGSSVRPVFLFGKQPIYRKRLRFFEVAEGIADQELTRQFSIAFDEAMRTAR
jgi:hypothetical protein